MKNSTFKLIFLVSAFSFCVTSFAAQEEKKDRLHQLSEQELYKRFVATQVLLQQAEEVLKKHQISVGFM